jgi:hypothetical protein
MMLTSIWATENEVSFVATIYFRPLYFDAKVITVGFVYMVLSILELGFAAAMHAKGLPIGVSAHLIGATLGTVIAAVAIKGRWVDCEGFDAFSLLMPAKRRQDENAEIEPPLPGPLAVESFNASRAQIAVFLDAGNVDAALTLFRRLRSANPDVSYSESELTSLIRQLLHSDRSEEAEPLLAEYVVRFPRAVAMYHLAYASFC